MQVIDYSHRSGEGSLAIFMNKPKFYDVSFDH